MIEEVINPAYVAFAEFFAESYWPACRESVGLSSLPGGREAYNHALRYYTSLDTDAHAIHALGRREVGRIRREMEAVMAELDFKGEFDDFLTFLRSDPQFYASDEESYLHRIAWIAKTIEARLPRFFSRLPGQSLRHQRGAGADCAADHHRLLPARRRRRHPRGSVLRERLRSAEPPALRASRPGPARVGAGPSPADLLPARERQSPGLAAHLLFPRLRRRLGPLQRVPRRGNGRLHDALRTVRAPHLRHVARGAACRGYRPARHGLDAGAGHRLHAGQHGG